jgi:hypothetical protein
MNTFEEHADVRTQPPMPARTPLPAVPIQAARLQHKSPVIACLLSLMPGIGQIYVGYYRLGFIHNIVFITSILLLANDLPDPLYPPVSIFLAFFVIYNVVDAGRRAMFYNLAIDGVEGIELPNMNIAVPSFGGSFAGGLALMAIGGVLLSNTRFGVSLDWLEEWWPAAPILLGAYLFVKALQERRGATAPGDRPAASSPMA